MDAILVRFSGHETQSSRRWYITTTASMLLILEKTSRFSWSVKLELATVHKNKIICKVSNLKKSKWHSHLRHLSKHAAVSTVA